MSQLPLKSFALNDPHMMADRRDPAMIWQHVLRCLKQRHGQAACESWLGQARVSASGGEISLAVPTRFKRDWVRAHYLDAILTIWRQVDSSVYSLDIVVDASLSEKASIPVPPEPATISPMSAPRHQETVVSWGAQLDARFTFENYIIGKPNELAYAAALAVAESKTVASGSNPLFLSGGVGLGKTHLMHAIAWHIRKTNSNRRVIYLSAEKFMYQFISALRNKDILSFKEQFRSVDVLMIDDIQFISGKDSTQEEFFHTFNALIDQNRQLVISGDRSPSDLEGIEERVRSRLGWGLVADIHSTTYELRFGILQAKVEQLGVAVPKEVLEFLAHKITSNVRELEGALNKVLAHSRFVAREITLENAQDILRSLIRANERVLTIDDIQKKVAEHYNIRISEMHSARRSRSIARPRQVAMYLCKRLTTHSLPEIGRKFGGKDHTTVMHAVKTVEKLSLDQRELSDDIALLMRVLQG